MSTLNKLIGSTKEEDKLFYVLQEFNKPQSYLGIDKITTVDMGYVFEDHDGPTFGRGRRNLS